MEFCILQGWAVQALSAHSSEQEDPESRGRASDFVARSWMVLFPLRNS